MNYNIDPLDSHVSACNCALQAVLRRSPPRGAISSCAGILSELPDAGASTTAFLASELSTAVHVLMEKRASRGPLGPLEGAAPAAARNAPTIPPERSTVVIRARHRGHPRASPSARRAHIRGPIGSDGMGCSRSKRDHCQAAEDARVRQPPAAADHIEDDD